MKKIFIYSFYLIFIFSCSQSNPKKLEISIDLPEFLQHKKEEPKLKTHTTAKILISGSLESDFIPLSNATILVIQNGTIIERKKTNQAGYYELSPVSNSSDIKISFRKSGYCTKFCIIMQSETATDGEFTMVINSSLPKLENTNWKVLNYMFNYPATIAHYDSLTDNYQWDMEHLENWQKKIKMLEK